MSRENAAPIADAEWISAIRAGIEKFLKQGATALTETELINLRYGLQGFSIQCKRRQELAEKSNDILPTVRLILSALGGSVEH